MTMTPWTAKTQACCGWKW